MLPPLPSAAAILLAIQQTGTPPDTLVARMIAPEPGTFERITTVASGITSILILILVLVLILAVLSLRKTQARLNQLIDRLHGDLGPIAKHAGGVADDVHYISTTVRTDVQRVSRTVNSANERIQGALQATEEKMHELHSLLDVAQEEAEDIFLRSASTARGVRAGLESFGEARQDGRGAHRMPGGNHSALDPDSGEDSDADDGYEGPDEFEDERPRVRPRNGY